MARTFIAGLLIAVAAAITLLLNNVLSLDLGSIFLGIAAGGALGLANDGSPLGRLVAFMAGFFVAMIGYIVRVLVFNESAVGQIMFALLVLGILTVLAAVTGGWVPLWATLLGAATMVGAYELAFQTNPADIQQAIFEYGAKVLVPFTVAFIAALLVPGPKPKKDEAGEQLSDEADTQAPETTDAPAENSEVRP